MRVFVYTCAAFTRTMKLAFETGLTQKMGCPRPVPPDQPVGEPLPWPIADGTGHTVLLTYLEAKGDRTKLETDIESGDANNDMTVVCGGLLTMQAANKKCTKPFLVVTDQISPEFFTSHQFLGGIDLNTRGRAVAAHGFLVSHYEVDPRGVWLIWNQMGYTGGREKAEWKRRGWPDQSISSNDVTKIAPTFKLAKQGGATSVVLSADPFFTINMDAVIAAANDTTGGQLYVCYPFTEYITDTNNTHQPAPDYSMIYGPDHGAAYEQVGGMVVGVVDALYWGFGPRFRHLNLSMPLKPPIYVTG